MIENTRSKTKVVLDVERGRKPCPVIAMPWCDSSGVWHTPDFGDKNNPDTYFVISNTVANFLINSLADPRRIEQQIRNIAEFNSLDTEELLNAYYQQL